MRPMRPMRPTHPTLTRVRATVALAALLALAGLVAALVPGFVAASSQSPSPPRFTTQSRGGFLAGDDWEPATAADHFGHVYVLYKHYDVPGQTSCANCDRHVLLQISSDRGQTWSAPRAIDPEATKGGQFDSQIAVDPMDGKT